MQSKALVKAGYEPGMKVNYDPNSKRVIVAFRGRIIVLPDLAETEAAGIAAGESYCRVHGWSPAERKSGTRSLRSPW
jgi:hypothetical protein